MKGIENKTAIVTGGNRGIGLALTKKLLAENYHVIATSRSGEIKLSHSRLTCIKLELAEENAIEKAAEEIASLGIAIDLLINNAGIADDIMLVKPSYQSFKDTLLVNLTGTVFFTEAIRPLISEDAKILNISSAMGLLENAETNAQAYRISKAGLNFYTKQLAQFYKETMVKVAAIHPGWVKTRLGGENADVDADWSASEIFNYINNARSGEFKNVYSGESLML